MRKLHSTGDFMGNFTAVEIWKHLLKIVNKHKSQISWLDRRHLSHDL